MQGDRCAFGNTTRNNKTKEVAETLLKHPTLLKIMFYDYESMLARARKLLPERTGEDAKFEWPKPEVLLQGSKTIIRNFGEVCEYLKRDSAHIIKYLTRELATAANFIENRRLILTGKFTFPLVNRRLGEYVEEFVICPACGRHETELQREGRTQVMKCNACGSISTVRSI